METNSTTMQLVHLSIKVTLSRNSVRHACFQPVPSSPAYSVPNFLLCDHERAVEAPIWTFWSLETHDCTCMNSLGKLLEDSRVGTPVSPG